MHFRLSILLSFPVTTVLCAPPLYSDSKAISEENVNVKVIRRSEAGVEQTHDLTDWVKRDPENSYIITRTQQGPHWPEINRLLEQVCKDAHVPALPAKQPINPWKFWAHLIVMKIVLSTLYLMGPSRGAMLWFLVSDPAV